MAFSVRLDTVNKIMWTCSPSIKFSQPLFGQTPSLKLKNSSSPPPRHYLTFFSKISPLLCLEGCETIITCDIVIWDVIFMFTGYLHLKLTYICKKVVCIDIRNIILHIPEDIISYVYFFWLALLLRKRSSTPGHI